MDSISHPEVLSLRKAFEGTNKDAVTIPRSRLSGDLISTDKSKYLLGNFVRKD